MGVIKKDYWSKGKGLFICVMCKNIILFIVISLILKYISSL